MNPKAMQSKGGRARSEAKAVAAISNGHLGGRPGKHTRHRATIGRDVAFSGPVSDPENRAAHGNICRIDTCSCGAERRTNINGSHVERGPWTPREQLGE